MHTNGEEPVPTVAVLSPTAQQTPAFGKALRQYQASASADFTTARGQDISARDDLSSMSGYTFQLQIETLHRQGSYAVHDQQLHKPEVLEQTGSLVYK